MFPSLERWDGILQQVFRRISEAVSLAHDLVAASFGRLEDTPPCGPSRPWREGGSQARPEAKSEQKTYRGLLVLGHDRYLPFIRSSPI